MASPTYQLPQQPPSSQPTGELLNTQQSPQMPADKNVTSLSMPANEAMTHLGFANNMLHHLIEFKAGKGGKSASQSPQNAPGQEEKAEPNNPQEESQEPTATDAKMTKLELDMSKKFDDLRKELDEKHKLELDSLRNDIKTALDNETNEQD